jgi:hypothetical protein
LAKLGELRAREKHRLAGECAKARELFIDRQAHRLVERTGMDLPRARRAIERQCEGILLPDVELPFDDPELAGRTVADVLADPVGFEGETLADPLEGIEYGRGKARIMRRADGSVWINSFAHGRIVYELKLDCAAVCAVLEHTPEAGVVDTFIGLALTADLRQDEIERVKHLASSRSGVGVRALADVLKSALKQQGARQAQAERERRIAARHDRRPQLLVPAPDAEYGPEMKKLNAVIGGDKSAVEPPTRNANNVVAMVRKIRIPSLHALTSKETNLDDDLDQPAAGAGTDDPETAQ